jgi:hypothetical protein
MYNTVLCKIIGFFIVLCSLQLGCLYHKVPNPSPASEFVPPLVPGEGGPNSDDWRKDLTLCLQYSVANTVPGGVWFTAVFAAPGRVYLKGACVLYLYVSLYKRWCAAPRCVYIHGTRHGMSMRYCAAPCLSIQSLHL